EFHWNYGGKWADTKIWACWQLCLRRSEQTDSLTKLPPLRDHTMLAQLIPKDGGPPITLTHPITVVGRNSKQCDLVLDHTSISKQHCMLVKTDGLVYLRDLGSTNGTRVNGQRVIRGALLPGDLLSFAGLNFRIHMGPDPAIDASPGGRTEWMPGLPGQAKSGKASGGKPLSDSSLSDVRFLRDSDLLIPD
ncbi:MAG: hypothetical protein RLZZ232_1268, partial [Planctomycetota bacterium]